jgi:hypothetical protein
MSSDTLKKDIIEKVNQAKESKVSFAQIYNNPEKKDHENEFIFFIKPELTLESSTINFPKVLDYVFAKLEEFNLTVNDVKVLGADYLDKYSIISQHYGVINKLAANPLENMSDGAKDNLKKLAGVDSLDNTMVLGALQFLDKYKMFNADSLDILWQNNKTEKLAGGTYVEKIKVDTDNLYLINGFHPRQLTHFTEKGRNIVVFTVSGDLSWADARGKFIGATNPEAAEAASLRKGLLNNMGEFGIPEVNQGLNGVHLSAGPVEGLVELVRYNSNFSESNGSKTYNDFSFGKKLAENFSKDEIADILANKNVDHNGKSVSYFDLTEEKSANEALGLLKEVLKK